MGIDRDFVLLLVQHHRPTANFLAGIAASLRLHCCSAVGVKWIETAAEVFFDQFPNDVIESELGEFLRIYENGASRRNDIAHGTVISRGAETGWYLEANVYSDKRNLKHESPYAYTANQIKKIARGFAALTMDVNAFRSTLKEHFQSSDPKRRALF